MRNKDIDAINKWLAESYGRDLARRPYYRIVWSVGEVEKRKGEFHDYYGSIFIRAFYGVREQPKYAYHPDWRERWILERLDFSYNPELMLDTKGHYEPLYVFYDRDGNFQKPTMRAVRFFMFHLMAPKQKVYNWDDEEQKELARDSDEIYGELESRFGGGLATAIHQGEGVGYTPFLFKPDGSLHLIEENQNVSNDSVTRPIPNKGTKTGTHAIGISHSSM